jgi:topoisomerase IA-like protein
MRKTYGQYQKIICPFCERQATHKNSQGLNVCRHHVNQSLEEIRCLCGSWLELRIGKFGPYFNCLKCGNKSLRKALEIKEITKNKDENKIITKAQSTANKPPEKKKEKRL